jgi:hypothetical protein
LEISAGEKILRDICANIGQTPLFPLRRTLFKQPDEFHGTAAIFLSSPRSAAGFDIRELPM